MISERTYTAKQIRTNFALKNGGADRMRRQYPVIAGLIDTCNVLDAIIEAHGSGDAAALARAVAPVQLAEARSRQLTEPGLTRIEPKATVAFEMPEGSDGLIYWAEHSVCGFEGNVTNFASALADTEAHECHVTALPDDVNLPMSRAERMAFADANGGVEGVRSQGHAAVSMLLATSLLLDEFIDAYTARDGERMGAIASMIGQAEQRNATTPFKGNLVVDEHGNRRA
jgi:hypothetical protein